MHRKLPNFLVIGAAKAGTTSLYAYLEQHPQIFMSPIKETNYFAYEGKRTKTFLGELANNEFPITTLKKYEDLFQDARDESAIGEVSPLYLESPVAAERIKKLLPEVKLIAVLRNPVDRALSDYMMAVRLGQSTGILEDVLDENAHYVQVGFYYEKLKQYFNLFPREQIKIYLYADLAQDTLSVVHDMLIYLGVDPAFKPDVSLRHNAGGMPKNKVLAMILAKIRKNETLKYHTPNWTKSLYDLIYNQNLGDKIELPQDLRKQLINLYRENVLQVQDLIQRDLTHWLEA